MEPDGPAKMSHPSNLEIPTDQVEAFCRKWRIRELALFGSVLRDDFGPDSDIDVLVSFDDDAPWSLWDLTTMQDELSSLLGRPVDLVEREGLRNPFRRQRILETRRVIYCEPSADASDRGVV
jgi:predicted nucleotidyltransferase